MLRKSSLVSLGILGAVAALGVGCCCCFNMADDAQEQQAEKKDKKDGGGHGVRPHYVHHWSPIFFWGGGGFGPSRPIGTGRSSTTSRGGFGATAHAHGGFGG